MTEGSGDYIRALRATEEYSTNPAGFVKTINLTGMVGQDKIIIEQNNLIISLLVELHLKINGLMKKKTPDIMPELDKLTTLLTTTRLGEQKARATTIPKTLAFGTNKKS